MDTSFSVRAVKQLAGGIGLLFSCFIIYSITIALIDEAMPVVFIVTERGYDKVMSNIQEVRARGGRIIIITTEKSDELQTYSDHIMQVPRVHHCLQSILTTIPLQILAYHIAVLKGCDVDMPRNLAKSVTVE